MADRIPDIKRYEYLRDSLNKLVSVKFNENRLYTELYLSISIWIQC